MKTLEEVYQSVSIASIDAKISQHQTTTLMNVEKTIEYSNHISDSAGNMMSSMEQRRTLPCGLKREYDVAVETIQASPSLTHLEAVPALIVKETKLQESQDDHTKSLSMQKGETEDCN